MLKFRNSNLSKLLASLEDYKNQTRKASQAQTKAFRLLDTWASDTNNAAIQDVTSKLTSLYTNLDEQFNEEKHQSLELIIQLFLKFKEYDVKLERYHKDIKNSEKLVTKCNNDIKKCPASKSIRDCEIKFEAAKEDLKYIEFKARQVNEEIDATKSIRFKTEFKRVSECFTRQNEAERVLLNAMTNLIGKIPDVSNEEVDDIKEIKYTKQSETDRICTRAYKRLHRISTTRIHITNVSPMKAFAKPRDSIYDGPISKFRRIKSKIIGPESVPPPPEKITDEPPKTVVTVSDKLYPCLDSLNNSLTNLNLKYQPPPTYSDSESFYSAVKARRSIVPSAPVQTDSDMNNTVTIENNNDVYSNLPSQENNKISDAMSINT